MKKLSTNIVLAAGLLACGLAGTVITRMAFRPAAPEPAGTVARLAAEFCTQQDSLEGCVDRLRSRVERRTALAER